MLARSITLLYICFPSTCKQFLSYCDVFLCWILLWFFHISFCYVLHVGLLIDSWKINTHLLLIYYCFSSLKYMLFHHVIKQ